MYKFHVKLILIILIISFIAIRSNGQIVTFSLEENKIPIPKKIDSVVLFKNQNAKGYADLSEIEKDFYYWTNYSRANPKRYWDSVIVPIVAAFPQFRGTYTESLYLDIEAIKNPLPFLDLNNELILIAQNHAKDITDKNAQPGHTSSNGNTFQQHFRTTGINTCGSENISFGEITPYFALAMLYIDYGIPNLGHRKALLNPNLTRIGIGASKFSNGTYFYVQDFACP